MAKASLSLLDGTSKGSGKSRKTLKKAKEATGKAKEANDATKVPNYPMKVTFQADFEKAKKAAVNAKGAMTAATSQIFAFYANLFVSKQSTRGTRLSKSRQKATCMWIFKASLNQAQGECPASHLTIACCSTFSLCFPSTQQSKTSATSQMYVRSPSASRCISLYRK